MKASSVNLPGADEFTKVDFDPRPMDDQNNPAYQDYFRNVCLNFQGISKMPIFQDYQTGKYVGCGPRPRLSEINTRGFRFLHFVKHLNNYRQWNPENKNLNKRTKYQ